MRKIVKHQMCENNKSKPRKQGGKWDSAERDVSSERGEGGGSRGVRRGSFINEEYGGGEKEMKVMVNDSTPDSHQNIFLTPPAYFYSIFSQRPT